MAARVTIKSIAQDLGISHMTVSRALSNHPKVRKETRKAVLQRAQELGYVKSTAAVAMRGDKAAIVGLLIPNLRNEFYARFSNRLAELCAENGWQAIIHVTNDTIQRERTAILKLREIQASAVVMVPAPGSLDDESQYLRDLQIVQFIRTREMESPSDSVRVDDTQAICKAVQHLFELEHRRIAYIGGATFLSSGRSRLDAFSSEMRALGLRPDSADIFTDTPSFAMGYACAESIVAAGQATAIVCGGFEISNGALNACLQQGVNIPKALSFVGYGDPSYYRWINGGISTIKIPVEKLAAQTAALLGLQRAESSESLRPEALSAELIIRHSSGRHH